MDNEMKEVDDIQLNLWCQRLNIKYNERLLPYYEKGIALHREKKNFVIDKKRLLQYNHTYNIFRRWFEDVLFACDDIAADEDLLLYVYTFVAVLEEKGDITILEAPDRHCRATDFAPLFSYLYFIDDMINGMKEHGCSHQIISDTLYGFDSEMNDYYRCYGRSGMRTYLRWFTMFLRGEILRIGRLQFEIRKFPHRIRVYEKSNDVKILMDGEYMHKKGMLFGSALQTNENEKYFADIVEKDDLVSGYTVNEFGEGIPERITLKGYEEILKFDDYVISVHIPSDGVLDYELCERAYQEAEQLFSMYYSEYNFKAFVCFSWLMEKRLKSIVGKETNITKFADEYITYPLLSNGHGVYTFLYNLQTPVSPDKLAENTSMQRVVKKYLMNGNVFFEKGGIRLFKYCNE